jgi:hypothetical protein
MTTADAMLSFRLLAIVRSYGDLHSACRGRADALAVTFEQLDAICGLPDRYVGKLLGPGQVRRFGPISLGPLLSALGMFLIAVEDPYALEKYQARRSRRRFRKRSMSNEC